MRPLSVAIACLSLAAAGRADAPVDGAALYRAQCARCHGAAGEGGKRYKEVLAGERSVTQLAKVVQETMPDEDPGSLSAAEATAVAGWMHEAFYSPAAREKNTPVRVELARLTVGQYRNTLTDLVGSFRPNPGTRPDGPGLRGEYFTGPDVWNQKRRKVDRTDAEVAFDFGTESPGKDIDARQFAVKWTGAVVPPETGDYEFVVQSDQAVILYVNRADKPVFDGTVRSGDQTEFRGTVALAAGRPHSLRLEFRKAPQGVNDGKKKGKPTPARVKLLWKPPGGVPEVIPGRCLTNVWCDEVFAPATPFPADDRSRGWERGTTVSKAWDQATTAAAVEAADYVSAHADKLAGTDDKAEDRAAKHKQFCHTLLGRAFRKPLTDAEKRVSVDRFFAAGTDPAAAVRKVVVLALKSPRFLYREVTADAADQYAVAARLSYALWDSLPDAELTDAAGRGELKTPDQVRRQAGRMVRDPRAAVKLAGFVRHWLHVDQAREVAKNPDRFPGFDAAAVADLKTSLDLAIADVLNSPDADFRKLLQGDDVYVNARLAGLYGVEAPKGGGYAKVPLDPGRRAGVLTHPYLLSRFAYTAETSPIHRGVFLARGLLGVTLKPPSEAFTPLAAELHPTLSTRERVALQTNSTGCQTCHGVINPLGFTLEHFDAIGRYRAAEKGKPVDSSGAYLARDGKTAAFDGPRPLAAFLCASPEAHDAFCQQLFHHLAQQPVRAYGAGRLDALRAEFTKRNFNVRDLAVDVAVTAATTPRTGPGPGKVETAAK